MDTELIMGVFHESGADQAKMYDHGADIVTYHCRGPVRCMDRCITCDGL